MTGKGMWNENTLTDSYDQNNATIKAIHIVLAIVAEDVDTESKHICTKYVYQKQELSNINKVFKMLIWYSKVSVGL